MKWAIQLNRSRKWHSWSDDLNRISRWTEIDTGVISIACRRGSDGQFVLFLGVFPLIFSEPKLQIDRVILDINNIVICKGEAFAGRVELLDRMRPSVSIGRNQVWPMPNVAVIEVIVGSFNQILEANSDSNPSYKLLHLDSPLDRLIYHYLKLYCQEEAHPWDKNVDHLIPCLIAQQSSHLSWPWLLSRSNSIVHHTSFICRNWIKPF